MLKKNGIIMVQVLSFVNITMFADVNICQKMISAGLYFAGLSLVFT
jgi:hypothetical protein